MKKFLYSLALLCVFVPGLAQRTCPSPEQQQIQPDRIFQLSSPQANAAFIRDTLADEVIIIPVVIHILYNNSIQNISDAQVLSQMESLNNDFRKLNDIRNVPAAFASLSADSKITFCLAKIDPAGKITNGILHKYTTKQSWPASDEMKFATAGGSAAWDAKRYLNIWVCNLSTQSPGFATLPGSPADIDGIVIKFDAFGTQGNVKAPFNKGRTATHEVGHWLGLKHVWGDALCGDDGVSDTPPQSSYHNGYPSFPQTSNCSINANGDMFMNFMDFTDDICMRMFTVGQKNKMRSLFALGKAKNTFLNSAVCEVPARENKVVPTDTTALIAPKTIISFYPNPAKNFIIVEATNDTELKNKTVTIFNFSGRKVKSELLKSQKNTISIGHFPAGVYVLKMGEGREAKIIKFVKN